MQYMCFKGGISNLYFFLSQICFCKHGNGGGHNVPVKKGAKVEAAL